MPVRQVNLLGTVFSGSTILGSALHQLEGAYYVGAIGFLPSYHRRLFGRVSPQTIDCQSCRLDQRECPVWNDRNLAELDAAGEREVHERCRQITGCDLVVDGTKFVSWPQQLREAGAAQTGETRIIISARDPFSFCDSMKRRGLREGQSMIVNFCLHFPNSLDKSLSRSISNLLICWLTFWRLSIPSFSAIHSCETLLCFQIAQAMAARIKPLRFGVLSSVSRSRLNSSQPFSIHRSAVISAWSFPRGLAR